MADKVILAYSGGLDTSVAIPWLKENYGFDVVALAVDLNGGEEFQDEIAVGYSVEAVFQNARETLCRSPYKM